MSGIRTAFLALLLASARQDPSSSENFPPYRPVSLNVTKVPVRDALKDLSDRTGLPMNLSTCPAGREVTVQVENVPPLQALTEVCKAAMIGWTDRTPIDWRGRGGSPVGGIRFHQVSPVYYRPMAIQYVRHYRIQAYFTTTDYTSGAQGRWLHLSVEPAAGVRPHSVTGIRLTEATDENGQDVLPKLPSKGVAFSTLGIGRTQAGYSKVIPAEATPQKLARLKGSVTFRYPREVKWVKFPNPADGAPAPVTALGCRMSATGYTRKGNSHEFVLSVTPLEGGPIKGSDPETNLPFDFQEVELVTASGERLVSNGYSGAGGKGTMGIVLTMKGSKDEAATEIRIPWAETFIEDVVEFDLRDVVHQ